MGLTVHWFLPTTGDSREVVGGGHGSVPGASGGDRPPSLGYLGQIARAAELLGFAGVLTPTGPWCEDAWLTTAMLAARTERLSFLVAFRPGLLSPTLAAQMATTYQNLSGEQAGAERGDRRRVPRAARVRRLPRQGRTVRAGRGVPLGDRTAVARRTGRPRGPATCGWRAPS